jgi:hypothetical protein
LYDYAASCKIEKLKKLKKTIKKFSKNQKKKLSKNTEKIEEKSWTKLHFVGLKKIPKNV